MISTARTRLRNWEHATLLILILVNALLHGRFWVREAPGVLFHLLFLLALAFVLVAGHGLNGSWGGLLIDSRCRMSLSRLQSLIWTLLLLVSYVSAVGHNLALEIPGLLPPVTESWLILLFIPSASMLAATVLLAMKGRKTPDSEEFARALQSLAAQGRRDIDREPPYGLVVRYTRAQASRWSDLVMGDEVGTAGTVDLFKVQLAVSSSLVAVVYYLGCSRFLERVPPVVMESPLSWFLPEIDVGILALFGVSNAAYLAGKAMPRSREGTGPVRLSTVSAELEAPKEANVRVELKSLKLTNLRSFTGLELNLTPPAAVSESGSGQLVLLLGDNGVGKSTILKALTLALVDPAVATALFETQRTPAPFVRIGAQESAEVSVQTSEGRFRVAIHSEERSERIEPLESGNRRPALFAYGSQRGSAVGRSAREVSFPPMGAVATLFQEGAELIHAETWLIRQSARKGKSAKLFFEALEDTLLSLLRPGVTRLKVSGDGVFLSGPDVGKDVPLAALSDGYLSTMGWILDFLARWSHWYERVEGRVPEASMAAEARGLVLIDEVGLHLHPRWQIHAVKNLRTMFPNMSFVASSHQPLTLLGAGPGEVHVLKRDQETGQVYVTQAQDPRLLTGTELYSTFFEVDRLYPDDLGDKLDEYAQLAVNPYRSDEEDERTRQLLNELRTKQIDVLLEPVERILDKE